MIIIEDKELENAVMKGEAYIAVPIEIYKPVCGETEITVYSQLEGKARELESIFGGDCLSADALKWIDNVFSAIAESINYRHIAMDEHMLREYIMRDISQLHKELILPGTRIYESEEELTRDGLSIPGDMEEPTGTAALAIADNTVVSAATLNDVVYPDGSLEINVYTAENYRRRGYGESVTASLSERILSGGNYVRYNCACANNASVKIAERCGFEYTGTRYSYVCYSIE